MTISAVSYYQGGSPEALLPLCRQMQAILRRHGILAYRVSRVHTGAHVGQWLVIVDYPDWPTFAAAQDSIATDPEHRATVTALGALVTLITRDLVASLDL